MSPPTDQTLHPAASPRIGAPAGTAGAPEPVLDTTDEAAAPIGDPGGKDGIGQTDGAGETGMAPTAKTVSSAASRRLKAWFDRNILELGRQFRLSFLPPLMVYLAAGVSGLTGIVGTFFIKEHLGLSAEFLASLGFWVGIPWALKMPVGHIADLIWRWKAALVVLGATMITASLGIMIGLIAESATMATIMPVERWFVLSALLSPIGYVIQDTVADAMTVEAVPRVDSSGRPLPAAERRRLHTTMQTLGRVAVVGGGVAVSLTNVVMFRGVSAMNGAAKSGVYLHIYEVALIIPLVSVLGVALSGVLRARDRRRWAKRGLNRTAGGRSPAVGHERPRPNWWILGGGLGFSAFTVGLGLGGVPYGQEIIFVGSMAIVCFLISRLATELDDDARRTLIGTAAIIFVFRAMPGPGAGASWWQIDILHFDQRFMSVLSLIGSSLALFGMVIFRRFMAERSIAFVVGFLTVAGTVLSLPILGMYYGLQEWTAAHSAGIVDARFIAVVDTTLESPLGQIAMIPMLAWIADSAPANLKATFFAVMASFTNLALSLSQLGTKYLNGIFAVTREVSDRTTGKVSVPADYSELGWLLLTVTVVGFMVPIATILLVRYLRRSA